MMAHVRVALRVLWCRGVAGTTLRDMTTTLITGANKGLGYETARRLLGEGHDVWVAARDETRGRAAAEKLGARFVQLDVTDDGSVAAAVETVGALDVLVNNAGISGGMVPVPEVTPEVIERVLATNVVGLVRVTQAFAPLLAESENPVIVNVSSGMGSLGITTDPERLESTIVNVTYSPSKAAVNMLTSQYAKALPQMRVNAVDPGYTATDFNHHRGVKTVEQGAEAIVQMALLDASGPTGTYVDDEGTVPW
jgi:NAD(P)-dependent dehydrogenase (short-subunit alcohol dehydrogenase family)